MTDVEHAVRAFIGENFVLAGDEAPLGGDDSLMEQGLIDSTGVLELVAFLESEFSLELSDDELVPENLDTVNNLVAFLGRRGIN